MYLTFRWNFITIFFVSVLDFFEVWSIKIPLEFTRKNPTYYTFSARFFDSWVPSITTVFQGRDVYFDLNESFKFLTRKRSIWSFLGQKRINSVYWSVNSLSFWFNINLTLLTILYSFYSIGVPFGHITVTSFLLWSRA